VGSKGKPAEEVAREAAEQLLLAINQQGCVDEHLQDQVWRRAVWLLQMIELRETARYAERF